MSSATSSKLTHARLREVLQYAPESGDFFWRVPGAHRRAPGDKAGSPSKDGRIRIRIDGTLFYRYRLAWFYVTGAWPRQNIDHRNGHATDDRWDNLRDVSQTTNMQNIRRAPKRSSTGVLGAQALPNGRFASVIRIAARRRYLGSFDTVHEAHAAYLAAKRQHHAGNTL